MINRDPEECVAAQITFTGDDAYLVVLVRADGESIPVMCRDAQGAADLLDRMNPAHTDVCIAESPARTALLDALGTDGAGITKVTLH